MSEFVQLMIHDSYVWADVTVTVKNISADLK